MKILISHVGNTLNYGSAMMAASLVAGLREHLGNVVDIYCECDDEHLQRLRQASGDNSLTSYMSVKQDARRGRIRKAWAYAGLRHPYSVKIRTDFDAFIVLGGDDLSETYQRSVPCYGLMYKVIRRGGCQVILAGQSLGPYTGLYKAMAKRLFKSTFLVTREDNSYAFATQKLAMRNTYRGRDFAFTDLPNQEEFSAIVKRQGLDRAPNLVFVPSGLAHQYTEDVNAYVQTWRQIVHDMAARYPSHKIVLLAHVLAPERGSDRWVIDRLMHDMDASLRGRTIVFSRSLQPAQARAILGCGEHVITGRMHAAVSACCMGVPPVSLAYSEKFFGVVGKGMRLDHLIVDCRNNVWNAQSVREGVLSRVSFIDTHREELTRQISDAVQEHKAVVKGQIAYIADCLVKGRRQTENGRTQLHGRSPGLHGGAQTGVCHVGSFSGTRKDI
ncbi:MAG: hypothetical protein A2Y76_06795 [Planctomycetes bacterium RBG_13_60_9]|nr:MAG: hypothetical protein A2Y76_06795 [Planctomycetes bacterium RBG_13_60_9]